MYGHIKITASPLFQMLFKKSGYNLPENTHFPLQNAVSVYFVSKVV